MAKMERTVWPRRSSVMDEIGLKTPHASRRSVSVFRSTSIIFDYIKIKCPSKLSQIACEAWAPDWLGCVQDLDVCRSVAEGLGQPIAKTRR